jgi:hypothetical protein
MVFDFLFLYALIQAGGDRLKPFSKAFFMRFETSSPIRMRILSTLVRPLLGGTRHQVSGRLGEAFIVTSTAM